MSIRAIEEKRVKRQACLDELKSAGERNRLGQFATPPALALEIARYVQQRWQYRPNQIRFIDPAVGTGSFYSAIRQACGRAQIERAVGIEIDPAFAEAARSLWKDAGLCVTTGDFTRQTPPLAAERFNLVLTNPPYVRHHHLSADDKKRLKAVIKTSLHLNVSGLSGLYVYFLLLSHEWMEDNGVGVWLIPSEFMTVNYGKAVREYLTRKVQLTHVHRFRPSDVQFCDALVTSAIVVFRKAIPAANSTVRFTYGGSILEPEISEDIPIDTLKAAGKWTAYPRLGRPVKQADPKRVTLGQIFTIKRGIATGANGFFILPREKAVRLGIPAEAIRPILPSPRHLRTAIIEREADGWPSLQEPLGVVDCRLPEKEIQKRFPGLWAYLEEGKQQGIHKGYLTSRRTPRSIAIRPRFFARTWGETWVTAARSDLSGTGRMRSRPTCISCCIPKTFSWPPCAVAPGFSRRHSKPCK